MKSLWNFRYWSAFIVLVALLAVGQADDRIRPIAGNGTFTVLLTWDDVYKTPATGVYIEAHGFAVDGTLEKSFVFKMLKAGQYEVALPPGVYDVFVSEASSVPRCKRVLITAGYAGYWSIMLEHDDAYLQR